MLLFAILMSVSLCLASGSDSDRQPQHYRITLTDGSTVVGEILSEDDAKIQFKTLSGVEMVIRRSTIDKIVHMEGKLYHGKYRRIDPNHSRLLFSATARPVKAREGYFAVYELFFSTIAVGIGDVVTLAGGITLFPGPFQIYHISPKITFLKAENVYLAAGVMHMGITGVEGESGFGIAYGVGTLGSETAAVTLGLGWGYAGEDGANKPTVMVGGELQLSDSFKLLTENWYPPGSESVISMFGMRLFGDKLAADLGFIFLTGMEEGWPFFPWVGFVYNLGR